MVLPVVSDSMRVTDPVVKRVMKKAGMDVDYVEFHDYDRTRPYAKLYVDRKSDKRVMVMSGLPMVRRDDGSKLVPGWESTGTGYVAKNNLFQCEVVGGRIALAPVNDQPWGMTVVDEMVWEPVLYVGREEVGYKSVTILPTDPWNPNYHDNVLEFDYGVCKRRVRVIEGRLRERWVFGTDPGGEVRIVHNTGTWKPKLGTATGPDDTPVMVKVVDGDMEVYRGPYPVTIGASSTFYPDADPETSSVDGYTYVTQPTGVTWSTLRTLAGDSADSTSTNMRAMWIEADSNLNKWAYMGRGVLLFDTSSLGGATVDAATLSIYGYYRLNEFSYTSGFDICVYSSNPDSNTTLIKTDYSTLGSTAFSTSIAYDDFIEGDYNDFVLNSSGIAQIDTSGVSKFGTRNAYYDADGNTPSWESGEPRLYIYTYASEKGVGYKPKLAVTYTEPKTALFMDTYRRRRST